MHDLRLSIFLDQFRTRWYILLHLVHESATRVLITMTQHDLRPISLDNANIHDRGSHFQSKRICT